MKTIRFEVRQDNLNYNNYPTFKEAEVAATILFGNINAKCDVSIHRVYEDSYVEKIFPRK